MTQPHIGVRTENYRTSIEAAHDDTTKSRASRGRGGNRPGERALAAREPMAKPDDHVAEEGPP